MSEEPFFPMLADHREDNRIIAAIEDVNLPYEIQQLGVSDYVISDRIAIERKRSDKTYDPERKQYHNDCRDSLKDGRLYTELYNQKENFDVSILILECADKKTFFSERFTRETWKKVELTVTLKMDTHIVWTDSYEGTALYLKSIWDRMNRKSDNAPINRDARPKTLREKQRYLLAGLEGCGPKKVDALLAELGTPMKVFEGIRDQSFSLKNFGKKFFANNQAILEMDSE